MGYGTFPPCNQPCAGHRSTHPYPCQTAYTKLCLPASYTVLCCAVLQHPSRASTTTAVMHLCPNPVVLAPIHAVTAVVAAAAAAAVSSAVSPTRVILSRKPGKRSITPALAYHTSLKCRTSRNRPPHRLGVSKTLCQSRQPRPGVAACPAKPQFATAMVAHGWRWRDGIRAVQLTTADLIVPPTAEPLPAPPAQRFVLRLPSAALPPNLCCCSAVLCFDGRATAQHEGFR